MSEMNSLCLNYIEMWYWRFVYVHRFKINIWHYSPLLIMVIMLIMLIKKVAQSCRPGNKAEFVHKPIGNMNQSKNLTLLTISRFSGRQLDYNVGLILGLLFVAFCPIVGLCKRPFNNHVTATSIAGLVKEDTASNG